MRVYHVKDEQERIKNHIHQRLEDLQSENPAAITEILKSQMALLRRANPSKLKRFISDEDQPLCLKVDPLLVDEDQQLYHLEALDL